MMRRYATIYSEAHHQVMNEAQWIEFKKTDKFKAVKDILYVHRAVTDAGKNILGVTSSEASRKNIEKITAELSKKEAKRIYREEYEKASDDVKQDMIYGDGKYKRQNTPHDIAKGKAEQEYLDRLEFSPDKMSISAVKERFEKQDNYMENSKGNFKRVYETGYDKTTVAYTHNMAKFAANVEIMPEIVLKGKTQFEGTTLGEMLTKMQVGATGKTKVLSDYVMEVVKKQMGVGGEKAGMYDPVFKVSESIARAAAKLGLSFPTAGIKNIGTGTAGSLGAFRVSEFAKGVFDVMKGEEKLQREFLETAATETGVSIYEPTGMEGKFDRYLNKWSFRFGLMKPTEIFNRKAVVFASKHEQRRLIKDLQELPKTHRKYKNAEHRFKSFYKLTDSDVSLLAKYGSSDRVKTYKSEFASEYDMAKRTVEVLRVEQKMNHAAHVFTQGSSADLFMPHVAGLRGIRPLTLYKRMAFAATKNTLRNTNEAMEYFKSGFKRGDGWAVWKPLVSATATYFTGSALLGIYSSILGKPMPNENSEWWERFMTTMWRGEFLGLLSEAISPYDRSIGNTLHPAIHQNATSLLNIGFEVATGKAHLMAPDQGLDEFMQDNWSLYGQVRDMYKRKISSDSPMFRSMIQMNQLHKEWKEPDKDAGITFEKDENTPYNREFQRVFYFGTAEEFAKQYVATYMATLSNYLRDEKHPTFAAADKAAKASMDRKVKALNPNPRALFKTDTKLQKYRAKKWVEWLQKHPRAQEVIKDMVKQESLYHNKIDSYMKQFPYYLRKLNLQSLSKEFDWKPHR